jgi:hypothetical protein
MEGDTRRFEWKGENDDKNKQRKKHYKLREDIFKHFNECFRELNVD